MQAIVTALGEQHAELEGLLDTLDEAAWQAPTRCEGWMVIDVVLHLAQTDELALASVHGRFAEALGGRRDSADAGATVDDGAAAMVEQERGEPPSEVAARWRRSAAAVRAELAGGDPHRRVDWVAGQLSMQTLAATRLAECWIHTGDVAEALGVELEPTDRLEHIARLAWRTLPYAFGRAGRRLAGPVAFELEAPSGRSWDFRPDTDPITVIEGSGAELCLVAARRVDPGDTALRGRGPDAAAILDLVRTYA